MSAPHDTAALLSACRRASKVTTDAPWLKLQGRHELLGDPDIPQRLFERLCDLMTTRVCQELGITDETLEDDIYEAIISACEERLLALLDQRGPIGGQA